MNVLTEYMKRILLAFAISFILVFAYLLVVSVIFVLAGRDTQIVPYLDVPLRLTKIIYYYFFPPTADDYQLTVTWRKAGLSLLFFITNILIYSIPIYFLLRLIGKRKRKPVPQIDTPPAPPRFDENSI